MRRSMLCVVKERREREEEFKAVCDSDSLSFLPGLSLQAASGQELYQVSGNEAGKARWMLEGDPGCQRRDGGTRKARGGSEV